MILLDGGHCVAIVYALGDTLLVFVPGACFAHTGECASPACSHRANAALRGRP